MRLWAVVLAARLLRGLRERGKEGGREGCREGGREGREGLRRGREGGKETVQECTWPAGPIGPKRIDFTITSKYCSLSRLQTGGLGRAYSVPEMTIDLRQINIPLSQVCVYANRKNCLCVYAEINIPLSQVCVYANRKNCLCVYAQ
jgi:hypothetical protein